MASDDPLLAGCVWSLAAKGRPGLLLWLRVVGGLWRAEGGGAEAVRGGSPRHRRGGGGGARVSTRAPLRVSPKTNAEVRTGLGERRKGRKKRAARRL